MKIRSVTFLPATCKSKDWFVFDSPLREFDISGEDCVTESRQDLLDRAGNLAVDVALYDDHYATGKTIKVLQSSHSFILSD